MLSKFLNIALVLLVVGLLANYLYRLPKYNDGEKAPSFTAELQDGSQFELESLSGKYVLLDFWGSWCAPCRRENPELVKLYSEFSGQSFLDAEGFEIVSVAIESNENTWQRAIKKDGLDWKYHIVQTQRFKSPIAVQYGVREIPTKYLLGPDGNILSVNAKPSEIATFLKGKSK